MPNFYAEQLQFIQESGSLTLRLTELAQGAFTVKLHACAERILTTEQLQLLNVSTSSQLGQVREVYLCGENEAWVFARSFAVKNALKQANFDLCKLKNNSLGSWLYSHHNLQRTPFTVFDVELEPFGTVTSRQSVFSIGHLNIVVMEYFLPTLWKKLNFI